MLGIGRSTAYRLVSEGDFPVVVLKVGRQLKVPLARLEAFINGEAS